MGACHRDSPGKTVPMFIKLEGTIVLPKLGISLEIPLELYKFYDGLSSIIGVSSRLRLLAIGIGIGIFSSN